MAVTQPPDGSNQNHDELADRTKFAVAVDAVIWITTA